MEITKLMSAKSTAPAKAANPYASYKMDANKERDGVVIVENEFFRITGKRAGGKNAKYETFREFLTKPHRRAIATSTLDKTTQDRLNAELAAGALVALWETNSAKADAKEPAWAPHTIHDPATGEVVPYTEELAVATFVAYEELYDQFARGCSDIENFIDKEQIAADLEN